MVDEEKLYDELADLADVYNEKLCEGLRFPKDFLKPNKLAGCVCGDNRFKIIEKAKEAILESTNIESSPEEMAVLDNFLFRCWQMGWLKEYEEE